MSIEYIILLLIYIFFILDVLHKTSIINFAWAEPQMKLVTASADLTSKLCSLNPSGILKEEREFTYDSTIQSVMFSPGSSGIYLMKKKNYYI